MRLPRDNLPRIWDWTVGLYSGTEMRFCETTVKSIAQQMEPNYERIQIKGVEVLARRTPISGDRKG